MRLSYDQNYTDFQKSLIFLNSLEGDESFEKVYIF